MPDSEQQAATELFWKLHRDLPQQGPGSDASTRRALSMISDRLEAPRILDLGCGPGRQSVLLAQETGSHVVAVDLIDDFLTAVRERARAAGVADRVETRKVSFSELDDADESFDLVWSEGAIYNLGFARGLRSWQRLLPPGGVLAVTECVWLDDAAPPDIVEFWKHGYPDMPTQDECARAVAETGFRELGRFTLPASDWWDDYYRPIEARLDALADEREDDAWQRAVAAERREIDVVRRGLGHFGYAFFVLEKTRRG